MFLLGLCSIEIEFASILGQCTSQWKLKPTPTTPPPPPQSNNPLTQSNTFPTQPNKFPTQSNRFPTRSQQPPPSRNLSPPSQAAHLHLSLLHPPLPISSNISPRQDVHPFHFQAPVSQFCTVGNSLSYYWPSLLFFLQSFSYLGHSRPLGSYFGFWIISCNLPFWAILTGLGNAWSIYKEI